LRWLLVILLLLLAGLQYRLWWGEGGRLELRRLQQQAEDYARENALLRERNAELARQVMDLKTGQTVLEQRAREELGLTGEDELYYQFVDPQQLPVKPPRGRRRVSAIWAVVPAAGSGSRMAGDVPKQYLQLRGRPILDWSVAALLDCPRIRGCVVALPAADLERERRGSLADPRVSLCAGGASRAESVAAGLAALSEGRA
jgi:cell division protein FtsB